MSIQDSLSIFASAIGNAIKPFKYIPAKPVAAGQYELAVNAQGQASWAAPVPAAASGMPYSAVWRTSDQTGRSFTNPVLAFNDFVNGIAVDRANNSVIGFGLDGRITLAANRVYLLRMTLQITGAASGAFWFVGFNRFFTPNTYSPPVNGLSTRINGRGTSDTQTAVHEFIFRTTAAETLWCSITGASDTSTSFTLVKGSTAFAQQIA